MRLLVTLVAAFVVTATIYDSKKLKIEVDMMKIAAFLSEVFSVVQMGFPTSVCAVRCQMTTERRSRYE